MSIHPTATVSPDAVIPASVEIGPYCAILGRVTIGEQTVLESHCRIGGRFGAVTIGAHNYIQSGAALGGPPQDWSYAEEHTELVIGDHNRIGEYATLHLGSRKGGGITRIGDRNFIMAYAHVAHDCQLADDIVMINGVQLAGHVSIGSRAVLGGTAIVTQFTRIGELSFITAGSAINKDILPYTIAEGRWAKMRAVNRVGLTRAGVSREHVHAIDRALRPLLGTASTVSAALDALEREGASCPEVERLIEFARASEKGIARG